MTAHLVECTITALVALVLVGALRRFSASLRYAILVVAILRFAVPTPWVSVAGAKLAACLPARVAAPLLGDIQGLLLRPGGQGIGAAAAGSVGLGVSWEGMVGIVWGVGTLLCFGVWVRGAVRRVPGVRAANDVEVEAFRNAALQTRGGFGNPPQIWRSAPQPQPQPQALLRIVDGDRVPGAVGFFRPVVILPDGLSEQLSAAELEAVCAHEMAHIRRRDNLWAAAMRATAAVFWFHPLVWWMERRALMERELACDELVLAAGWRAEDYSSAIGKVCRKALTVNASYAGINGANLTNRLERIMMQETVSKAPRVLRAAPVLLAVLGLLLPVAAGFVYAQAPGGGGPADALYNTGFACYKEKDYAKAEEIFRQLRQLYPRDTRGVLGLVEVYTAQNRMADSIELLRREGDRSEYQLALGNILVRAELYREALAEFEKALKTASTPAVSADLYFRMGETYRRMGNLQAAAAMFQRSKEFGGDNAAALQLALILDGTGQKDRAMEEYKSILAAQPNHPVVLNNLAFSMAEKGDNLEEALRFALRAKEALPESEDVADTVGWIYLKLHQADMAVGVFGEILLKHEGPNSSPFREHLAQALDQKTELSRAERELRVLLPMDWSAERERRIKELLGEGR